MSFSEGEMNILVGVGNENLEFGGKVLVGEERRKFVASGWETPSPSHQ